MRIVKCFGLFSVIVLSAIACKNSSQPKKTGSFNTDRKTSEIISNDSIKKEYETKNYDNIAGTNDWYSDADGNSKQLKLVKINGKIGFIYENGQELFPCIFDSIVDVKNSGYTIINGKYGPAQKGYFTFSYNNSRFAKVRKDGKWGLITIDGKVAIPFIYDEIYDFDYTKTSRMEGPYIDFFDYYGKIAVVRNEDKWGLVNIRGKLLVDFIYEEFFIPDVRLFYENRAAAKKDGKWGFLNENGSPVSSFIYDSIGSTHLKNPQFISTFYGSMAVVKKSGQWGAIDIDGKEKVPFIYNYISSFTKELAIVEKEGKWGYINKNGAEVIPIIYEKVKWDEMDLYPVKKRWFMGVSQ